MDHESWSPDPFFIRKLNILEGPPTTLIITNPIQIPRHRQLTVNSETTPNPLKRLTWKSGPGIHRPPDNLWPRDLPVRISKFYLSWSGLVGDSQNFVGLKPEPLGPGPIGFGPWIPGRLEARAKSNEFSFMISECP